MLRTQATICGAPKAIAIPRIAPRHQPQASRFAIAMAPRTITRITAMGVSHARMFVCSDVAPVRNGEVACATASRGTAVASAAQPRRRKETRGSRFELDMRVLRAREGRYLGSRLSRGRRLLTLSPRLPRETPGRAEAEALNNE